MNHKFNPEKLIYQAKVKIKNWQLRFIAYIKRLLFPLYLFPLKLVTYSTYYLAIFLIKLLIWPFKSYANFFKTIFWGTIFTYFAFTEYRFLSLVERYGGYGKFFCSEWAVSRTLKRSVVRVVGGLSEGSGFFVSDNQILTNFHVIADEPSPKVVFPDGRFTTPYRITAIKTMTWPCFILMKPTLIKSFIGSARKLYRLTNRFWPPVTRWEPICPVKSPLIKAIFPPSGMPPVFLATMSKPALIWFRE